MDIARGFGAAQEEYDRREPGLEPEAIVDYRDRLTYQQQVVVCREYLTHVSGWSLYEDWAEARPHLGKVDYPGITNYCEELPSFWSFLCGE